MSTFSELVNQARTMVKGIDWDRLDSQGQGIPLDPNVPAKLGYWVDYLTPAFNRAADVMNTLYYDPLIVNTASTQSAVDVMYRLLQDSSPGVQAYERFSNLNLLFSPLPLPIEDFRLMISYVWGVIMYGTKLHTTFAIAALGRQTMRDHAERVVMLCEALSILDQFGALDRLKWNSQEMVDLRTRQGFSSLRPFTDQLSGTRSALGLPTVVTGVIIAVGAVVLLYGIYEWSKTATEINKNTLEATRQLCSDPSYTNDADAKARCVKVLGDALANSTMIKPPGFVNEILKYGLIAGGVLVAIYLAPVVVPLVVRSFKGTAENLRKPATT